MHLALPPALHHGSLYVLQARLDGPPLPTASLAALLSGEERDRAARFVRQEDSTRHLVGRGLLRLALSQLTGVAPRDLDFHVTEEGKPYLRGGPSFNLSHSGHLVVLALGHEGRVGVDVEEVRPLRELGGLARASFAEDEIDALLALPGAEQIPAFFRIWTRKEAMLKALGCGLGGLESISVSIASNAGNMLRRLDRAGEVFANWTVESLHCLPEFEAAVAWDRPVREIICINL